MRIFNTLTKKKESFTPLHEGNIGMYLCGPTVYDVGHIGHARGAVSFDVIRKYLQYRGYKVKFVSNYTDVEDKIIKRAKELGISEPELVKRIIPEYEKDYGALGVLPPDVSPRATEYIPAMVKMVEELVQKGFAYATDDGIYFEVKKFRNYGKLSGQKLEDLVKGARVEVDEKKKNPEDFALWKKEKQGEPSWDGPLGMRGRPGWHIECSVMTKETLGETFDIHAGGIDLVFPHHECEIAQSESANGKPFAKYWLHNGHVKINKEKMSKSLGNFFTIKEVLAKYHPKVVRYFLLSTHYRMPIDYTPELLEQAKASLERFRDCYMNVQNILLWKPDNDPNLFDIPNIIKTAESKFNESMDDDFEISRALAALFDFMNEVNLKLRDGDVNTLQAQAVLGFFKKMDAILGVMIPDDFSIDSEVDKLITERIQARKEKNFTRADEIRKILAEKKIILEDTDSGTTWKKQL